MSAAQDSYSDDDDETLHDIQARLRAEGSLNAASPATHPYEAARPLVRQPLLDQPAENYHDNEKYNEHYHDADDDGDDEEDYYYEEAPGCCNLDHDDSCGSRFGDYVCSRRGAKLFGILFLIALVMFSCFNWILYPELVDERMRGGFINPVDEKGEEKVNTIGIAKGGEYQHGPARIQDLDEMFVPGGKNDPDGKRRLIFVGDIHGCRDELFSLLEKVDFDPKTDHLIATGDTINKGPHSAGVLDYLIKVNATTVRGNHEDRLIHTAKTVYDAFATSPDAFLPTFEDTDSLIDATSASRRDAKTLKKLHARHLRYMQHMPLILRIRPLPQAAKPNSSPTSPVAEAILVVHAGLVPALPLEKQDPYFVTNMRSLHAKSHVPSADRAGKRGKKVGRHNKPWRNVWNWYNDRLFRHKSTKGFRKFDAPTPGTVLTPDRRDISSDVQGYIGNALSSAEENVRDHAGMSKNGEKPQVVVYGHDAKGGLRIKRWSKGMDSACVGGGRLSALVMNAKGEGEVFDVTCPGYW